jgi:hypothetical protein
LIYFWEDLRAFERPIAKLQLNPLFIILRFQQCVSNISVLSYEGWKFGTVTYADTVIAEQRHAKYIFGGNKGARSDRTAASLGASQQIIGYCMTVIKHSGVVPDVGA